MTDYDARLGLYIAGEWRGTEGRETQAVHNPATGEVIGQLPLASTADLDDALAAADRGFKAWRAVPQAERAAVLMRAAALIRERGDHLARLATLDQGKISAESKTEPAFAAKLLEWHAAEAQRIYGRVLERPTGTRTMVLHQPIGPVAAFCAWNFPIINVVRKVAPAVAAGCSVILKPSEETPGAAVEIFRIFQEAGLPGDVAQCVFGVPDVVSRHLLASPVTRKLSFTGSVPVGKHLAKLAAETMMKTTMELGGHNPVMVFDDCDLDKTVATLVTTKFRNAGQVCVSPTRFHVQSGIYDRFAKAFTEASQKVRVGAGLAADSQMGPLANPRRVTAMEELIADAEKQGGRLLAGGGRTGDTAANFFQPTVVADVPLSARAMTEEPFGPIALLHAFDTEEEALTEANRLPYGLGSYAFTENGRRQNRIADAIESGMIGINGVQLSQGDSPFGGWKDSGFGSEDGPEGVQAHLSTKTVHIW